MYYQLKESMTMENVRYYLGKFKCQRCKDSCCTKVTAGIILKPEEVESLAGLKGLSKKQFKERYTFTKDGNRFMVAPCPFYEEGIDCTIHSHRPQVCRQYPFNRSHNGCITINPNCPAGRVIGEKYGVKV